MHRVGSRRRRLPREALPGESDAARYDAARTLLLLQGSYYLATGIWPLLHMRSFELITGPKTDRWLVRTVGFLAAGVGAGLLHAGVGRRPTPELRTVSLLCAAGFIAVDVPTALRGRISPVYLLDAVVEAGFLIAGSATAGGLQARTR